MEFIGMSGKGYIACAHFEEYEESPDYEIVELKPVAA